MLITLHKTHATFTLKWAITTREGLSKLGVLLSLPPLFLVDMLHATHEGFDS
jgi:hypothetical protein